jgi:tetratricopeptide (TPR) repeat protein
MSRAIAIGLVLLLLASSAGAAPPSADVTQAKKLFVSGTKHYNLREYNEALADFREAFRLKDDPVFLYNIAQCYRMLENRAEAVSFYKNYLRVMPTAPNRAEVEQRIVTLEKELAAAKARADAEEKERLERERAAAAAAAAASATQANAVTATPPPRRKPLHKQWWLWTAVGGAVVVGVALGVGLGLGLRGDGPSTFPNVDLMR